MCFLMRAKNYLPFYHNYKKIIRITNWKHIGWDSMNLKHFPLACSAMSVKCKVVCALMLSLVCLSLSSHLVTISAPL